MPIDEKKTPDYSEYLEDKSGKLQSAIADHDETVVLKILMKEKKEQLAKLLIKLIT